MLLDVLDQSALATSVRDELGKCYPDAKVAHVKDGGNFPYLSRDQEVNMYVNHTQPHTHINTGKNPMLHQHYRRRRHRPDYFRTRCPITKNRRLELSILCPGLGAALLVLASELRVLPAPIFSLPFYTLASCCDVESFSLTLHGVSDSRMCIVAA